MILVDDCSTDADLKAPLADYIRLLPKVRLLSNDRRRGLIVSRMKGARLSRSPVLFFMDAHAEVNVGWLEPLLIELKRNPSQVLQPFVDSIDAMTIAYNLPGTYHKGSFSWDLRLFIYTAIITHSIFIVMALLNMKQLTTLNCRDIMNQKNIQVNHNRFGITLILANSVCTVTVCHCDLSLLPVLCCRYTWIRVADHIQNQAYETGLPFFSPTLVGCAIAVQRQYFLDIGGFDEGLKVWGGENIELGFRTWMCGGQVTTVTCSRVGHVFKVRNCQVLIDGRSSCSRLQRQRDGAFNPKITSTVARYIGGFLSGWHGHIQSML